MAKYILGLVMASLIWSCAHVPLAWAGDAQTVNKDGSVVIATVNGKAIYEEQLNQQVQVSLSKFKKYRNREVSPDILKLKRDQVLNQLIDNALIVQASQALPVTDIDKKIDMRIGEIRKGSYASKLDGKKDAELRDSIKKQIVLEEYLEKNGIARPVVPEEDIRDYYEKNQGDFTSKESVKVRHILVKVGEDAAPEEKEQMRKKINAARQLLMDGKDFAAVAKEYSECDSATAGGDLGCVEKGFMPPEFDKIAFTQEPGQISEVVQTRFGYHLLVVSERKPESVLPYDENVRAFIEKFLQGERKRQKLVAHIDELRHQARIEIFAQ